MKSPFSKVHLLSKTKNTGNFIVLGVGGMESGLFALDYLRFFFSQHIDGLGLSIKMGRVRFP
jgi:hypothetical protein